MKRNDGFHDLSSCFIPVPWKDILEIIPAKQLTFTSSGTSIPCNANDNLCLKAYDLLKKDFELPPVHIHLHKIIPIGAGLGGGSSDAAFTLRNLNDQFQLKLDDESLIDYAKKLGSDCAFFIKNKPVIAMEKGDVFEEFEINLSGKHLVLIYPNIHVSTREAFSGVTPQSPKFFIKDILQMPIENWRENLINDFETSIFPQHPLLKEIKQELYKRGAVYASMSGSGSTLFAIFEQPLELSNFSKNYKVWYNKLD